MQRVTLFPLYHGTNTKTISMSTKERCEIENICQKIAENAYNFLRKHYIKDRNIDEEIIRHRLIKYSEAINTLENVYDEHSAINQLFDSIFKDSFGKHNTATAFRMYCMKMCNSGFFQYGAMYLTPSAEQALNHAKIGRNFGEIETIARIMDLEANKHIDYKKYIDSEKKEARERFYKLSMQPGEPVVIEYRFIPEKFLLKENGEKMTEKDWNSHAQRNFRVVDGIDISKYEYARDVCECNN